MAIPLCCALCKIELHHNPRDVVKNISCLLLEVEASGSSPPPPPHNTRKSMATTLPLFPLSLPFLPSFFLCLDISFPHPPGPTRWRLAPPTLFPLLLPLLFSQNSGGTPGLPGRSPFRYSSPGNSFERCVLALHTCRL